MQISHVAVSGSQGEVGSSVGSWVSGLGATLGRFASRLAARHRAVADIRQLYRCTNREFQDMGLNRGDIPSIIDGTYRRD